MPEEINQTTEEQAVAAEPTANPVEAAPVRRRNPQRQVPVRPSAETRRHIQRVAELEEQVKQREAVIQSLAEKNNKLRQQVETFRTYHQSALETVSRHLGNVAETIAILQFKGSDI